MDEIKIPVDNARTLAALENLKMNLDFIPIDELEKFVGRFKFIIAV